MTVKIALIGYGAIAQEVMSQLSGDADIQIAQILVRPGKKSAIQTGFAAKVIDRLEDLSPDVEFVLECAGHEAVWQNAPAILERGTDFGVISVGALADQAQFDRITSAQTEVGARLVILPGAIGGIDALAAAGQHLESVEYTSHKPPMSWAGSPAERTHDLAQITTPTEIFAGSAREAAARFPKNANVVATVALAGIGMDKTRVSLMAMPEARGNTHHISAKGPLFDLNYTTQGAALAQNPKTSALTAFSAVRSIRHRAPGIVV